MEFRRTSLLQIAEEAQPASVRHIYYRAVVAGLVEKKETGYRKVQRQLLELRRAGRLPFSWIVDEGRRAHWPLVETTPQGALFGMAYRYRRNPWQGEDAPRVEIWCESESIAGTLMPLRDEFAVPIFPVKGQGSETFIWNAASDYRASRPVTVLYAGDYDPAGKQIAAQTEGKLRDYIDPAVELDFHQVAITDDQAQSLQALGTPPKQAHWKDYFGGRHEFAGQAIEAEAIDPTGLRQMFADRIASVAALHYGRPDVFSENDAIEAEHRDRLIKFARGWSA